MSSKKVLFVGSFKSNAKDGGVGGQMFACKTIINSSISNLVDWTLIDTTADTNMPTGLLKRASKAFLRILKFTYNIIFFKHDVILIFVADGWSFWEKGLMSLIAKKLSTAKVILAPRSGHITDDIEKNKILSRFILTVFKQVDIVVCQSLYWKNIFINFCKMNDNEKFIIIENMIDFEKYGVLPVNFKSEQEEIVILFMAWVKRNKGIYEFLDALKLLKEENLKFKAIIAGKGEDYDDVHKKIIEYGLEDKVIMKGWVLGGKKLKMLAESDIFVLPTYFEGYPNSLMEAMASGKACIATKVGSIPDMISNMETGILIDKKNSSQLFESLKILIVDAKTRNLISANSREIVRLRNSIQFGVEKFKSLLINN